MPPSRILRNVSAAFRRFVSEEIGIKVVRAKATSDCFAFPLTRLSIMRSCEVDLCFTAISISDRFEIRVWPRPMVASIPLPPSAPLWRHDERRRRQIASHNRSNDIDF